MFTSSAMKTERNSGWNRFSSLVTPVFGAPELREIERLVSESRESLLRMWNEYFTDSN